MGIGVSVCVKVGRICTRHRQLCMRLYAPKAYLLYTAMQTHVHTSRDSVSYAATLSF